jgi:hypothetical protein
MADLTNPNDPIYQQNTNWLRPGETVDQWKARTNYGSASNPVITADALANAQKTANISNYQDTTGNNYFGMVAGLGGNTQGTQQTDPWADLFKQYMTESNANQAPNTVDMYNTLYGQSGIAEKQAKAKALQDQINAINTQGQVSNLKTGAEAISAGAIQGRNIETDRNNAIAILPLAAQLSAAQGDLTTATQHLDTLYKIQVDYAQSQYEWKQKQIDAVYEFATKRQQQLLDEKKLKDEQAFTLQRDEAANQHDVEMAKLNASLKPTTQNTPTSYDEWILAGGIQGTGKTYAEFLQTSKAPTQAEQTVAEYASRIEQSNPIIEKLQSGILKMNPLVFAAQKNLPNALQTSEMQQYMQSARNFINAKLRRESGAVISPTEFSEAYKQYLPQPGDKQEVLNQKKANRDLVYASLKKAAGAAYSSVNELLGTNGSDNDPLGIR